MSGAGDVDVIVVGAGVNGLAAALALARAERRVIVLERRTVVGGLAAGDEFHPGFRAAGPLADTTGVRRSLLEAIGGVEGLEWDERGDSVYVAEEDGPGLLLAGAAEEAAAGLDRAAAGDGRAYAEYAAFIDRVRPVALRLLDDVPPDPTATDLGSLRALAADALALRRLGRRDMMELLRVPPMCVADWLHERFSGTLLKCALAWRGIDGAFMGPWSPGSAANLLRWEVLRGGGAVRGGAAALVEALADAARAAGADVRTGVSVASIRIVDGRVAGVELAGGEVIEAPLVAASCDPRHTLLDLVPRGANDAALVRRMEHYRAASTTAQVNLALRAPLPFAGRPELRWTRACLGVSLDDMERAFDHAKYGRCSARPIVELSMPSADDPSMAPEGGAVISALVRFAPYTLRGGWTDQQRSRLGDAVVDEIARFAPAVRELTVARAVLAPPDLEDRFGVTGGHRYHGEHALDQLLARPTPACARYAAPISGLYLCGAGSHPGGGLTCGPGLLAARAILDA